MNPDRHEGRARPVSLRLIKKKAFTVRVMKARAGDCWACLMRVYLSEARSRRSLATC